MKNTKYYFPMFFIFYLSNLHHLLAQQSFSLKFNPIYRGAALSDTAYSWNKSDTLKIESLKFYISLIELSNQSKTVWKEENSFHLIDAANKKSTIIVLNIPKNLVFTELIFKLGIDSLTNVSGALGGDLDPTKGMYWTWQSGYINFKLEGKSNVCKTRNNAFKFHLGGYQFPNNALQTIRLGVNATTSVEVFVDIENFFQEIDLSSQNHIMSPGKDAVQLSEKVSHLFYIKK